MSKAALFLFSATKICVKASYENCYSLTKEYPFAPGPDFTCESFAANQGGNICV